MAKKSKIETNNRRIRMAERDTNKRRELKEVIMNKEISIEDRFAATIKLASLPRNGASIRIRNRCRVTGRPRGYYRKFGLSRIMLRELASKGMLPGIVKASW
jgi:small subunit ribosomal protein S14